MRKYIYYSPKKILPSGVRNITRYFILLVLQKLIPKYIFQYLQYKLGKNAVAGYFAGLNHNLSHQKILIQEAFIHGRVPVIHKLFLASEHNFGCEVCANIEDFYDLDKSYIVIKNKKGEETKKSITYIKAEDFFKLLKWRKYKILRKNRDDMISELENIKYNLIIRQNNAGYESLFLPEFRRIYNSKCKIVFKESAKVKKIGDSIIQELGTKFYTLHYRYLPKELGGLYKNKEYQRLLHVDLLAEKLPKIFNKGEKIYLFSDVWSDKNYFDSLKKDYILYYYHNFPALKKLIDTYAPNTFLLFAIEKYIAKSALRHFELHWKNRKELAMLLQK